MELLEKMRDRFDKKVKQIDKQLQMVRDRVSKMEIGVTENVKSEALVKEIEELVLAKEKLIAKRDVPEPCFGEGLAEDHRSFLFETTRPAYRGRQVRPPVQAVILPVFALIVSAVVAYLSVLAVGATC